MKLFHDDHPPCFGNNFLVKGAGSLRGSAENCAAASCVFMPEHCEYLGERQRQGLWEI
jgi:hypothetical protein